MPEGHESIVTLIREFQAAVARAAELFRQHRGLHDFRDWRSLGLGQSGTVDHAGSLPYYFHGIGCAFHFPDGSVVDWDWGHDGRNDGFDEWRLRGFWETRPQLRALFPNEPALKRAFTEAVEAGRIVQAWRKEHDSLYYLPEDIRA